MSRFRSESYYEKTCTMGVMLRATKTNSTKIYRMMEAGIIEPGMDEYTKFNLFSAEDIDKVKFCLFCKDRMKLSFPSMTYLIQFLTSAMPDLSWTEMQDVLLATANTVDEKKRRRAIALSKIEKKGPFGREKKETDIFED